VVVRPNAERELRALHETVPAFAGLEVA
jgi:hypothetical protein